MKYKKVQTRLMSVTSRKMQEKWPSRLSEVLLIKRKRKRKTRAMFRTFFHVNEVLKGPVYRERLKLLEIHSSF